MHSRINAPAPGPASEESDAKVAHVNPPEKHRSRFATWWVLDPRTEAFVAHWDLAMTFALFYVALVTPVEVAFIDSPVGDAKWRNPIFLINRLLDCIFITDMCLQFRLAYKEESVEGTRWIVSAPVIAKHYLTSFWFYLDFFSVLTSVFDLINIEGAESLVALKAVRTLRLLKLVKLARGSRVFKRWEMRMSINYSALSLTTILVGIILTCHWTACLWGIAAAGASEEDALCDSRSTPSSTAAAWMMMRAVFV